MRVTAFRPFSSRRRRVLAAATGLSLTGVAVLALPQISEARELRASAVLKGADGASLGYVRFTVERDKTLVQAHLRLPGTAKGLNAFHGFHLHANDKPENGVGCVADPTQPASTWFVSADGHLSDVGATHGSHKGDLPSLLVNQDGTADIAFTSGRLSLADLKDRVVIVHADPDNFGNVPVGTGADQYTPNGPDATTKTANTGNAGGRIGCGLVQIDGGRRS